MQHETIPLPKTNAYGFYEIRLESIGGLGANLSGQNFRRARRTLFAV